MVSLSVVTSGSAIQFTAKWPSFIIEMTNKGIAGSGIGLSKPD
jgi:hypothetical protein